VIDIYINCLELRVKGSALLDNGDKAGPSFPVLTLQEKLMSAGRTPQVIREGLDKKGEIG